MMKPLQQYSKTELNQRGYELVFLDVSYLFDIKYDNFDRLIREINNKKLKPVVNLFLIGELLKGLDEKHPKFKQHRKNKELIMRFFDETATMWVLEHNSILTFEFVDLYYGRNSNAYDAFKIFFHLRALKNQTMYRPGYSKEVDFIYKPRDFTGTYSGLLGTIFLKGLKEFQNDFENGIRKNNNAKEIIKNAPGDDATKRKRFTEKQCSELLKDHGIDPDQNQIKVVINDMYTRSCTQLLVSMPFFCVEDEIFWTYINKNEKNDFMDSMHARTALSYCDYFITKDTKLAEECRTVIKKNEP